MGVSSEQTSSVEVSFAFEFSLRSSRGRESAPKPTAVVTTIPRIARLMALAIRFEGLVRSRAMKDYAEIGRLGHVTRARMTQIMKLIHLAPDIQEQLLFLPEIEGLNERNLRAIVEEIDWDKQRPIFRKMIPNLGTTGSHRQNSSSAGPLPPSI
jgi:hypothetical protein